jgi:hypothetical protein
VLVLTRLCWGLQAVRASLYVEPDGVTIAHPGVLARPIRLPRSLVSLVCIDGNLLPPPLERTDGSSSAASGRLGRWRPPVMPSSLVPSMSGIVQRFPRIWPAPVGLDPYTGDNMVIVLSHTVNTADLPRRGLAFFKLRGVGYMGIMRQTPINGILARAEDLVAAAEAFADWDNVTAHVSEDVRDYLTARTPGIRDLPRHFGPTPGVPLSDLD